MDISGKITGIKYKIFLSDEIEKISIADFDINKSPSSFVVDDGKNSFSISKWVSPKRTRSYPYERVYNTLNISKKVTVIPIVKDEGAAGDRDFLQWDTISLMSLLDVFVILAYYEKAKKRGSKISEQEFNNEYVIEKIRQIKQYHSSALHWNLNELKTNLHFIIERSKKSYSKIEKSTGVKLHNLSVLNNFKSKIGKDVSQFMAFSRDKAKQAQAREFVTIQPKESLSTSTKAKITIVNFLGGQYFFTVDEVLLKKKVVSLIEAKHTKNQLLPSLGDIKDGLLKMILYCNLSKVTVNGKKVHSEPVLMLTSKRLKGEIESTSTAKKVMKFFKTNKFNQHQLLLINNLFQEANHNKFKIIIKKA